MAKCSYCGSTIIFGGKREGELTFCNEKCLEKGIVVRLAQSLPENLVQEQVTAIHQGNCPKCQGRGPVDVHVSYRVWSVLIATSWQSRPQISCRSCGVKSKLGDAAFCLLLGWWGFPWGLIMTPVQIIRNLAGLFSSADPNRPSPALTSIVRATMAAQFLEEQQGQEAQK